MTDLLTFKARICITAGGFLVKQDKVLLVKHKKLGIWLAPGGHVEAGELPHQAAEREGFEETNIKVHAVSATPLISSQKSQYLPTPLAINLHWISPDNYHDRLASKHPQQPHVTPLWPNGCEQHLNYSYLFKAEEGFDYRHDPNESDGIGWFGLTDLDSLQTTADIKLEIALALKNSQQIFK